MIFWRILKGGYQRWIDGRGMQNAASLAFYTLISLAPTLLIIVGLGSLVFSEMVIRSNLAQIIEKYLTENTANTIVEIIRNSSVGRNSIWATLVGVLILLFGSSSAFANLSSGMNEIWSVTWDPSRNSLINFLKTRLFSVGVVFLCGYLFFAILFLSTLIGFFSNFISHHVPWITKVMFFANDLFTFLVLFLIILVFFKVLPAVKLRWRDVAVGALFTSFLFMVGNYFISQYLTKASTASLFGAAGSLVLLLFWVYYSSLIFFLGAALTQAYIFQRGIPVTLVLGAVWVRREFMRPNSQK